MKSYYFKLRKSHRTYTKSLCELIKYLHDDILLIFLQIPKLTKTIENQDWFIEAKYYEPRLVSVNCQTPTIEQLPRWILNRANQCYKY